MKLAYWFIALCIYPAWAQGEIYKAIDKDGHVTYSSSPIKGGKKLILEPLPTMMPPARPHSSESFPKVDRETQRGRDDTRRKILQDELNAEQKLLEQAQQNLAEGESNPEVFKGANGHTYRNVAKYQEKIKPLQDEVDLHQQNINALKTELSKIPE